MKGVFAGADVVTGPANVVRSIAQGKRGAESIHRYLRGKDLREGRRLRSKTRCKTAGTKSCRLPVIPVKGAKGVSGGSAGLQRRNSDGANRLGAFAVAQPCRVSSLSRLTQKKWLFPGMPGGPLNCGRRGRPKTEKPCRISSRDLSDVIEPPSTLSGATGWCLSPETAKSFCTTRRMTSRSF